MSKGVVTIDCSWLIYVFVLSTFDDSMTTPCHIPSEIFSWSMLLLPVREISPKDQCMTCIRLMMSGQIAIFDVVAWRPHGQQNKPEHPHRSQVEFL